MSASSRVLFILIFLAVVFPLSGGKTGEDAPPMAMRLSERTMVLHAAAPFSPRATVFASDKGLVVFDTLGTPSRAAAVRRRIEKDLGRKDFLYVINTHDHWDHWCGNQVFSEAVVVSHASCPAEMKRHLKTSSHPAPSLKETVESWKKDLAGMDPSSKNAETLRERMASFQKAYEELGRDFIPTYPLLTFSDRMEINLGRHTIKLYFTGGFETPDDIIAHVPEEGLVILGDTFQRNHYYASFENGIDVPQWMEVLDAILAGNVKFAVPGHGDPLTKEELAEIAKYLKISWEEAETVVRQDLDADQAKKRFSFESLKSRLDPAHIDFKSLEAVHAANMEAFRKRILKSK